MALTEKAFTVLSGGRRGNKPDERWLETLHRWLVRCPQCSQVRLVVGAQENDRYICKDCGHSFAIKL